VKRRERHVSAALSISFHPAAEPIYKYKPVLVHIPAHSFPMEEAVLGGNVMKLLVALAI
jgi:hypothetical protein